MPSSFTDRIFVKIPQCHSRAVVAMQSSNVFEGRLRSPNFFGLMLASTVCFDWNQMRRAIVALHFAILRRLAVNACRLIVYPTLKVLEVIKKKFWILMQ